MTAPTLADLAGWLDATGEIGLPAGPGEVGPTDAERIDQIALLERLKNALAGAQGRIAHDYEESQRAAQRAAGRPASRIGEGIAAAVALARRVSPGVAATFLGLNRVLATEMPQTARALGEGRISEYAATLLARETACLAVEHRATIDEEICGTDLADRLSRKQLVAEAHRLAARLDAAGVAERQALAVKDRRVTLRPAPDTMAYLTALVPVAEGVAMYAALSREADRAKQDPDDDRGRGQVMADTMVELVTGRRAEAPPPVDLRLVMTDRALLAGDSEPAFLHGYGIVPAAWARQLVKRALGKTGVWITRLYTAPGTHQLLAADSRRRKAPPGLTDFVTDRDQLCRTPWCGAPVRHVDHVRPHRETGHTVADDLQGLCERCNYAKEALGWSSRPRPGPVHGTETTTPTGHVYVSWAPPLPGGPGDPGDPGDPGGSDGRAA
ncbi:HNH endonuclease signature motif containing protein [Nocardioides sp.]|uniref:HNH endonuclease n=1 Tax=Nocardioides sp. TaxID=35761 RepID=UPI002715EF6B|nr:HNH endonuclease signature motif containing protein [Nocardioides sp.]MDO9456272.1 DUF222 domain-containing protein [Nocardioides sp.]